MSREIQVTFDAHDPSALSSFWRDALGYVHPGPPGVELPEGADPLAAWDDFLERAGVPKEERSSRSAIEDPDGHGPRIFFQQVPEDKTAKIVCISMYVRLPDYRVTNGWQPSKPIANGSWRWEQPRCAASSPSHR